MFKIRRRPPPRRPPHHTPVAPQTQCPAPAPASPPPYHELANNSLKRPLSVNGLCVCRSNHAEVEGPAGLLPVVVAMVLVIDHRPYTCGSLWAQAGTTKRGVRDEQAATCQNKVK